MFHGRISSNLVLLLLLVNFVSGFRLELMYISLVVSIMSSVTYLHGFRLFVLVHRNHFFHLYQQKKPEFKVKFRYISNRCKKVPESAKLAYAIKTKSPSLPRNLAVETFSELLILLLTNSTKVNLLYLLYSTVRRCCLLHLIK